MEMWRSGLLLYNLSISNVKQVNVKQFHVCTLSVRLLFALMYTPLSHPVRYDGLLFRAVWLSRVCSLLNSPLG